VSLIDLSEYYVPFDRQALFHKDPAKYRLYGGAMSGGKSVAICGEAIKQSLLYPGNRGLIGRKTFTSLRRTTLATFLRLCPPDLISKHNQSSGEIFLVNGSSLMFIDLNRSTDPRLEKLRSLEIGWFAIDEASEVDGEYFSILTTRLRWQLPGGKRPRYTGFMATNPEVGWLYDGFVIGSKRNRSFIPSLPSDNPYNQEEYLEDMKENLSERDLERFFYGNWLATEDPAQLISYQSVKTAHESDLRIELEWNESNELLLPARKPKDLALGVDVAREGDDATALTLLSRADDGFISELGCWTYHKQDTVATADCICGLLVEHRIPHHKIVVDSVGLGAGVVDVLRSRNIKCTEFVGGAKPVYDKSRIRYKNLRSQGYWYLRKLLREGQLGLQTSHERLRELTAIRYAISADKVVTIEAKDKIKARLGNRSPDRADSLMYGIMGYALESRKKSKVKVLSG